MNDHTLGDTMKKHSLISAIIAIFASCSGAFGSGFGDTYGFSTFGMSLGNAMCARVNDWSSVYYNMAGLGKTKGLEYGVNQIGLEYQGNMPVFDIDIARTDADDNPPPTTVTALPTNGDKDLEGGTFVLGVALDAGLLLDLPSFVSSARLGIGIGANDDLTAVKIVDQDPRTHTFLRYGSECQRLVVLSGMGFGFFNDLMGVGVGVHSAFGGEGQVLLEEIDLQTDAQSPRGQTKMDMTIEPNILLGLYLSPGKLVDSLEGFDLGFSYRGESILDIYPFQTKGETNLGSMMLDMTLAITNYYQPEMYTVGTALSTETMTLSLDLEYQRWSGFRLSKPTTDNFAGNLVELDDIFVPKIGFEYKPKKSLSLLMGYYYQPSFVSDQASKGVMNFLDNDKHVGSLGLRMKLPKLPLMKGNTELNLGYQCQYLVDRDVKKDSAAYSSFNPDYTYGGVCHTVMAGLTISR